MRKVYAGLFSTIDGVVEAPDQWQTAFDDEMGAALSGMLAEQDAVLLGRATFSEWVNYWPTSTDEPFASWINGTPKYVAASTLDSVDGWSNSTLIKGSVADFVRELREQPGGTIGTAGSPTLVRSLIDLGLCPPGPGAGAFMTLPNLTAPAGALPVNTAGGNLAEGFVHGIGLVLEAVRQIRGTSANQVPGADISLLLGGPVAPLVSATVFGSPATV